MVRITDAHMQAVAYFDGGSRGNPGVAGAGWVLYEGETALDAGTEFCGASTTNNVAEYTGALRAVETALRHHRHRPLATLTLRGDSKLVVEQARGRWKCNHAHLRALLEPLQNTLAALRHQGCDVTLEWVPRDRNQVADALSNVAMDRRASDAGAHLLDKLTSKKRKAGGAPARDRPAKQPRLVTAATPPAAAAAGAVVLSDAPATRVRLRLRANGEIVQGWDVYVGRECTRGPYRLPRHPLHNPVSLHQCQGDAARAVEAYKARLRQRPDLLDQIPALRHQRVACFCPINEPCHADWLVQLANDTRLWRAQYNM